MQGTIGVLTMSKAHHDQLLAQVDGALERPGGRVHAP